MPESLAKLARGWFEAQDKTGLVLERSTKSKTGFVNVKLIQGKYYQAQQHVSKKGRAEGGQKPLPGLWRTALEAAQYRALLKREGCPEPRPAPRKQRMTALEGEPSLPRHRVSLLTARRVCPRSCTGGPEHHERDGADENEPRGRRRHARPPAPHASAGERGRARQCRDSACADAPPCACGALARHGMMLQCFVLACPSFGASGTVL